MENFEKQNNKIEIQNVGTVMETDENGNLINEAGLDKIQEKYQAPIDDVIEIQREQFGDRLTAIYIRGSVAKGTAIDDISDLDTITLVDMTKEELDNLDTSYRKRVGEEMKEKYPFLEKVELPIFSKENISFQMQFLLKTSAVCVEGEDISKDMKPIALNKENASTIRGKLDKNITEAVEEINEAEDGKTVQKALQWVSKRMLRAGALLVATDGKKYTRDLYPAYEIFSEKYPEQEESMRQALEYALNPISERTKVINFIEEFGSWLVEQDKKVFDN